MPPLHPDALWSLATAKWAEIEAKLPDLAPALALQQRLLRLLLDASAGLDEAAALNLSAAADLGQMETWRAGDAERDNRRFRHASQRSCRRSARHWLKVAPATAPGTSATRLPPETIDAASLLNVSLARNQAAIRTSALHMGFSPDLVWLIGELGSSPLAHHLSTSSWWGLSRVPVRASDPGLGPRLLPVLRILAGVDRID